MSITSEPKRCPNCGGPIPAEAPQGLCPKCLLQQASLPTEAGKIALSKPPPPTHEELAAAFPHLEILELIGQGGMGFVFKARQPKLDRLVALKILPQSLAADPAFAERFSREGRVLARLNHPNIVTIHDFGQANGFFYLLMEFVDGVNLRQAMKVGRFTPAQALAIVPKICEALQFAHNEGILHRDIKPENILLDSKGRLKIADFGIAKLVGMERQALTPALSHRMGEGDAPSAGEGTTPQVNLTETGKVLGTPHYMAPEQLEHPQDVDHRADIYSLGVVFYEMLTGELPLGRFAPPSEKSAVDPRVDEVVLRTLEKERERRTQTAGEVKTQVETIASSASASSPAGGNPVPAPALDWRDRWLWERNMIAFGLVPFALLLLLPWLISHWGQRAIYVLLLAMPWLGVAVAHGWVGHRIRQLKSARPRSEAEVAEGWLAWEQGIWPFNRSQGLAILHHDRLELVPVWYGSTITVPLADIASLREVRWVYMPLFWKHGFALELANGQRVGIAIPEPFGRRWRARLSRGRLPELPAKSETIVSSPPRLSRTAVAGAIWAPLFFLAVLPALFVMRSVPGPALIQLPGPAWWQILLLVTLLPLGLAGPFGTTILGWIAVTQIRRSAGRIYGLGLAVFDGLLFPLLALNALIVWLIYAVVFDVVQSHGDSTLIATVLAVLISIGLDTVLVRRIWRLVNQPLDGASASVSAPPAGNKPAGAAAAPAQPKPDRFWRWFAVTVLALIVIPVGIAILGTLASIVIPSLSRARQRAHAIHQQQAALLNSTNPVPASAETRSGHQAEAEKIRDQAIAIMDDPRLKSAVDDLDELSKLSAAARQSAFSPPREVTLNDCDVQPEALDFETGRILVVPEEAKQQLRADNAEWFVKAGVDLLTDTTPKGVGLITTPLNELRLVKLANEEWQTLTLARLSEALSWNVSGLAEDQAIHFGKVYLLRTNTPAPVTLGFRTGTGAEGILQLTRFGEGNQPPLMLRYKLLLSPHPIPTAINGFGPVIERVLNGSGEKTGYQGLDIESGKVLADTAMELPIDRLVQKWVADHDIDLLAVNKGGDKWQLAGLQTLLALLPDARWEAVSTDDLRRALEGAKMEEQEGWRFQTIRGDAGKLTTFAFQTGSGAMGLLQTTGFTDNPRGVKIRYKLVDKVPATRQTESNAVATGSWSPTLGPGEKPDFERIREEANNLTAKGKYEEALQRHIWYHNHALEIDPGQTGVRLSFALSSWMELGRRYPKAKQALIDIRDNKTHEILEGRGYSDMFQEVASINRELQNDEATYALFKTIYATDRKLAKQCYFSVEGMLVGKGEYQLCLSLLGDPQWRFTLMRQGLEIELGSQKRMTELRQKSAQQTAEPDQKHGRTNTWSPLDTSEIMTKTANDRFIRSACQLVEILVGTGHQAEAGKIRDQAIAILDDPRLKSAVGDAERRVSK